MKKPAELLLGDYPKDKRFATVIAREYGVPEEDIDSLQEEMAADSKTVVYQCPERILTKACEFCEQIKESKDLVVATQVCEEDVYEHEFILTPASAVTVCKDAVDCYAVYSAALAYQEAVDTEEGES